MFKEPVITPIELENICSRYIEQGATVGSLACEFILPYPVLFTLDLDGVVAGKAAKAVKRVRQARAH
jgi:hypothetical protein